MKRAISTLAAFGLAAIIASPAGAYEAFKGPLGVLQKNEGVTDGYVLIAPQDSKSTYLIDNDGNIINQWKSDYSAFYAELLPNGNMVRHSRFDEILPMNFGGASGLIEEFDWSGKKVFEFKHYIPNERVSHHTFEVMPNGNYLVLGWEFKSYDEAVSKGLEELQPNRNLFPSGIKAQGKQVDGIWPDYIMEVDRGTGKIIWEWHVWDHLGKGKDQFDLNAFCPLQAMPALSGPDWTHFNGLAYNAKTNEICITSRNLGEVYIIDKATGKLTYRWGNPANYGEGVLSQGYGNDGDQQLYGPHAPDWTAEGHITILDNGCYRPSGNYTRAVELDPKTSKIVWEWAPKSIKAADSNFYSAFQDGVQKIKETGNYMITTSTPGHVIEVTADKKIVWEFDNPVSKDVIYKVTNSHGTNGGSVHKALRYTKEWTGFQGKDMKVIGQMPNWTSVLVGDAPALKPTDAEKAKK